MLHDPHPRKWGPRTEACAPPVKWLYELDSLPLVSYFIVHPVKTCAGVIMFTEHLALKKDFAQSTKE